MKGSEADILPPIGDKIQPVKPPAAPLVLKWHRLPTNPGYETDGASVRRIAG